MIFGGKYKRDWKMFQEATEALREDPFRKGDLVLLPAKGDVLFTGDIHGNVDNLERIFEIADLDEHPDRHVVVHELVHNIYKTFFSRDYSYECLATVAEYKADYPGQVHVFPGNHELAEIVGKKIMKDGRRIPLVFSSKLMKGMGRWGGRVQEACKEFIRTMPVGLRTESGIWFSHSLPERLLHRFSMSLFTEKSEGGPKGFQHLNRQFRDEVIEDLVWGRDYSPDTAGRFASKVKATLLICGHEACKGYKIPNPYQVVLDSKDPYGTYLLLPLDRRVNVKSVEPLIESLWEEGEWEEYAREHYGEEETDDEEDEDFEEEGADDSDDDEAEVRDETDEDDG